MSKFKLKPESIVFLRGAQEEMFSKLLQLQLAPNPREIVEWMFEHGVNKTITSYGFSEDTVKNIASSGTINISKWTSSLSKSLQKNPGHREYFLNLKHEAYSQSKKIMESEKPDALLAGMGGQTALNIASALAKDGTLDELGVELIGCNLAAIDEAEDRDLFKRVCEEIDLPVCKALACDSIEEVISAAEKLGSFPLLIRPAFTLGGLGGGTAFAATENRHSHVKQPGGGADDHSVVRGSPPGLSLEMVPYLATRADGGDGGAGGGIGSHCRAR